MKSLFFTLLILGGAFLAYDYYGLPPGKKIIFKSLNPPPKPKVVQTAPPAAPEVKAPVVAAPAPEAPAPVVTAPPPPPAPAVTAPAAPKAGSIEALTANWTKFPPSVFPREVKLLQDAEFKMSVGSSKVTAGNKAYAVAANQGILTVAPTASSPARAQVPIDGTDLKQVLTAIYEAWKVRNEAELRANAARRAQFAAQAASPTAASASEVEPGGKPVRAADGSYPLLLASIKGGQVTEIKPENIQKWQEAQPITVQGKPGWAVKVNFQANTVFGLYESEAQALVADGKVKGWYYTGSGEEVP
ncbi:MAG: hypothetical protein ACO1TE_03680 [Prosthecobacter sp.]